MPIARYPYLSAGVALVGASLIAVTPVVPPDLQQRAVQLVSTDYPLITPEELFTETSANLSALQAQFAADPFPVLTQMMANQAEYANEFSTALQSAGNALEATVQGLPAVLATASTDFTNGDIFDALVGPSSYLLGFQGLLGALLPVAEGVGPILQGITDNLSAVGHDGLPLLLIGISLFYAPNAETAAIAALGQNIDNDLTSGNLTALSNDFSNGLSTILGAELNGYPIECDACSLSSAGGLLTGAPGGTADPSVNFGGFENIIQALQAIAHDIGAPAAGATAGAASDLSALASDITGLFDPSTAAADLSNLLSELPSALGAGVAPLDLVP